MNEPADQSDALHLYTIAAGETFQRLPMELFPIIAVITHPDRPPKFLYADGTTAAVSLALKPGIELTPEIDKWLRTCITMIADAMPKPNDQ